MPFEPARYSEKADEVIEVNGLSLSFEGLVVLNDVSFRVRRGETLGVVGPNGAGKTSLLNCLSGTYRPQTGSMRILGRDTRGLRPHDIVRLGVARTFQNVGAFREMKVIDLAMLGRHNLMRYPTVAYAIGLPIFNGHEAVHRKAALEALDYVGMGKEANRRLADLPYGLIKLADLARTLASDTQVLLLDEPTSGLTQGERGDIASLLERIRDERRTTQVLIEHNMPLATRLCSRLIVLASGSLLAEGPPRQVLQDPAVVEAFLGGSLEEE